MPTWYEYERECDEIDDYLISEQKKAQKTLQNTLRQRERRARLKQKQNPLSNFKCDLCGKKASAIINGKTLCKSHLIQLKGGTKENGKHRTETEKS
jgi:hypothetical protein